MAFRRQALGFLLALIFVTVQFAALAHVAAHGFAGHKHDGKACEVYEYCEHMVLADGPVVAVALVLLVPAFTMLVPLVSLITAMPVAAARPRAPPAFA